MIREREIPNTLIVLKWIDKHFKIETLCVTSNILSFDDQHNRNLKQKIPVKLNKLLILTGNLVAQLVNYVKFQLIGEGFNSVPRNPLSVSPPLPSILPKKICQFLIVSLHISIQQLS